MGAGIKFGSGLSPYKSIKDLVRGVEKDGDKYLEVHFISDGCTYFLARSAALDGNYIIGDINNRRNMEHRVVIKAISIQIIKEAVTKIMINAIYEL